MPCASAAKAPWVDVWRIAANDGHARQRGALLGADDVDDALAHVRHFELRDVESLAVLVQRHHLRLGDGVFDAGDAGGAVDGGHIVIRRRQIRAAPPRLAAGQPQPFERLRRGDLVQQVPIDVQDRHAVAPLGDGMRVPDLVVDGAARHASAPTA